MFEKLNEDSWAVILQFVQLEDQLSLMAVSEDMKTIVQNNWKRIKEVEMDHNMLKKFKKEPTQMHIFLKLACGSLERLSIKGPFIAELLPSWKGYDFSMLRSLHFDLLNTKMTELTLLLSKLFPNITKLNYRSFTNHGKYLWNFSQLQELCVVTDFLDTLTLDRIFSSLPLRKLSLLPYCTDVGDLSLVSKCETLEELLIKNYHLTFDTLSILMKMPRLQRLSFYTYGFCKNFMRNLHQLNQESRVRSLVFNCSFSYIEHVESYIVRFTNLRRLVVQFDEIDKNQLYFICSKLKHLEELHLRYIGEFPLATDIWNMVAACRTLKVLNISDNDLDSNFLEISSSCLNEALKRRNADSPVTLHAHKTRLANDPQETIVALDHPYLKISFDPVHINTLVHSGVDKRRFLMEAEFTPLF